MFLGWGQWGFVELKKKRKQKPSKQKTGDQASWEVGDRFSPLFKEWWFRPSQHHPPHLRAHEKTTGNGWEVWTKGAGQRLGRMTRKRNSYQNILSISVQFWFYSPGLCLMSRFCRWHSSKDSACQCKKCRRPRFDPWARKIPWRGKGQPIPVFLPEEFHGQKSLMGCSPQGHKGSDTTELTRSHVSWAKCTPYG